MHDSFGYTVYVAGGVLESFTVKTSTRYSVGDFCLARAQSFAILLRGVVATAAQGQQQLLLMSHDSLTIMSHVPARAQLLSRGPEAEQGAEKNLHEQQLTHMHMTLP